jgi:hypothetical protein
VKSSALILLWLASAPHLGAIPEVVREAAVAPTVATHLDQLWCPSPSSDRSLVCEVRSESCTEPDPESEEDLYDVDIPSTLPFDPSIPRLLLNGLAVDVGALGGAYRPPGHSPLLRC